MSLINQVVVVECGQEIEFPGSSFNDARNWVERTVRGTDRIISVQTVINTTDENGNSREERSTLYVGRGRGEDGELLGECLNHVNQAINQRDLPLTLSLLREALFIRPFNRQDDMEVLILRRLQELSRNGFVNSPALIRWSII